ncbi:MAG: thioesterase family protein [Alphaproteobacteria bacterium]|nr:thioesterase family protein [Alphaproteobacteria bacterium]MBU2377643.1 thioesterase family protein [Alphaproteobacteria bacterium]
MIEQTLEQALTLTPDGDGRLTADLHGDFSNGRLNAPPETGFPFGGLIAALAASSMIEGLHITAPLRSLSVQYMTPARFGQRLSFTPRLLRGGRSATFAQVDVTQEDRLTNHASATFGDDVPGPTMTPLSAPPPLDALQTGRDLEGPLAPRFSQHVDYRFETGPHILQPVAGRPVIERTWMRTRDGRPLDAIGLCYLLDALYPPVWTALDRPLGMATVDLRYDILTDPTPQACPDGWAFFEFRMLDFGSGWTVDEATVWAADGAPLALSRQRRKLAPVRPARS